MRIADILIEDMIKEKILQKHNIRASEIKNVFIKRPYVLRAHGQRYMAIGYDTRFVTIIFEMAKTTAYIITAYPSSETQIRLYKTKVR